MNWLRNLLRCRHLTHDDTRCSKALFHSGRHRYKRARHSTRLPQLKEAA